MDFKVAEVTLQYKPTYKKQGKVMSSKEAYNILRPTFKKGTIEYREYAKVLYLNQASEVIAYNTVSEGGLMETVVDIRLILQGALQCHTDNSCTQSSKWELKAKFTRRYTYKEREECV